MPDTVRVRTVAAPTQWKSLFLFQILQKGQSKINQKESILADCCRHMVSCDSSRSSNCIFKPSLVIGLPFLTKLVKGKTATRDLSAPHQGVINAFCSHRVWDLQVTFDFNDKKRSGGKKKAKHSSKLDPFQHQGLTRGSPPQSYMSNNHTTDGNKCTISRTSPGFLSSLQVLWGWETGLGSTTVRGPVVQHSSNQQEACWTGEQAQATTPDRDFWEAE